jgi:putative intracellular protease/amidase
MENLKGLKTAILIENGFEQVEMVEPRKALNQAGAETVGTSLSHSKRNGTSNGPKSSNHTLRKANRSQSPRGKPRTLRSKGNKSPSWLHARLGA